MELRRLLHPRTVAVVGATERPGSYGGQTLLNLRKLGFPGEVWGVNPGRSSAHGFECFRSLASCPSPPDAVVVAIPAPGVPAVVEEAGALGCGGVVVFGAGFGEISAANTAASARAAAASTAAAANAVAPSSAATSASAAAAANAAASAGAAHEDALRAAAARHGLPVCGPNGNGIVQLHERVALWGDALNPLEAGRVALVSQSGNVAVNTLATRRGLRLHTVVSCGNSSALDPADWIAELALDEGVGSIAVYLEDDGDGARLCEALAICAEQGVGVAVLKVGRSRAGAAAAAAHTGAVAGDQRVFRALMAEAGAAWAEDVHELLEMAKALAVPGARLRREAVTGAAPPAASAATPRAGPLAAGGAARAASGLSGARMSRDGAADAGASGLAILTCSGGDSALAADECERIGLTLPPLGADAANRLRELLPDAATVANPLDYTALVWGETDTLRDIVATVGSDPAIDQVLVLYDQPVGIEGDHDESWAAVREGILAGAKASPAPVTMAATLPELLDDTAAARFVHAGVPAIAGLRTGLACSAALRRPPAEPARLREIARAASPPPISNGSRVLPEHAAKQLLREAGVAVVAGRLAATEEDAVRALGELGQPVALKLSAPSLLHKTQMGALALGLRSSAEVREAHRRLAALAVEDAAVLVERMADPGLELLVAARREAVVPAVVVGLGGMWTEIHDDVAIVPLPASPERVERALRSLRGAPLLTGDRGRAPLDTAAVAALASSVGELLVDRGLSLIELNPVLVYERGAVAVDAVVRRGSPWPTPA